MHIAIYNNEILAILYNLYSTSLEERRDEPEMCYILKKAGGGEAAVKL